MAYDPDDWSTADDTPKQTAKRFFADSAGAHVTSADGNATTGANALLDNTDLHFRDGTTDVARFGASGSQLGKNDEAHLVMDANSMELYDENSTQYFFAGDTRDVLTGETTVIETHIGDGATKDFTLGFSYVGDLLVQTVTYSWSGQGIRTDTYTDVTSSCSLVDVGDDKVVRFTAAPSDGTIVRISYTTTDAVTCYSLGGTATGDRSVACGTAVSGGVRSLAAGDNALAAGAYSIAVGFNTVASGTAGNVSGRASLAGGDYSMAAGTAAKATGNCSFASGSVVTASGAYSFAQGSQNTASGAFSHAEGANNTASATTAHAEGRNNTASGFYSHAEGQHTTASDYRAHAEGYYTTASSENQHVSGKYNVDDSADTYAEIIGNGTADNARSNARTLDWSGNEELQGELYLGGCTANGETPYPAVRHNTSNGDNEYYDSGTSSWVSAGSSIPFHIYTGRIVKDVGSSSITSVMVWTASVFQSTFNCTDASKAFVSFGNGNIQSGQLGPVSAEWWNNSYNPYGWRARWGTNATGNKEFTYLVIVPDAYSTV